MRKNIFVFVRGPESVEHAVEGRAFIVVSCYRKRGYFHHGQETEHQAGRLN